MRLLEMQTPTAPAQHLTRLQGAENPAAAPMGQGKESAPGARRGRGS